jgi:hypothetical protein
MVLVSFWVSGSCQGILACCWGEDALELVDGWMEWVDRLTVSLENMSGSYYLAANYFLS